MICIHYTREREGRRVRSHRDGRRTSVKANAHAIAGQTPLVSITIRRTAGAKRRIGRSELKPFSKWNAGRPETELNFKFYRQATNKIVRISDEAAAFLSHFF